MKMTLASQQKDPSANENDPRAKCIGLEGLCARTIWYMVTYRMR